MKVQFQGNSQSQLNCIHGSNIGQLLRFTIWAASVKLADQTQHGDLYLFPLLILFLNVFFLRIWIEGSYPPISNVCGIKGPNWLVILVGTLRQISVSNCISFKPPESYKIPRYEFDIEFSYRPALQARCKNCILRGMFSCGVKSWPQSYDSASCMTIWYVQYWWKDAQCFFFIFTFWKQHNYEETHMELCGEQKVWHFRLFALMTALHTLRISFAR